MPKDEWAAARTKDLLRRLKLDPHGTRRRKRRKKRGKGHKKPAAPARPQPTGGKLVPQGVPCLVCRPGTSDWLEHTTTKTVIFHRFYLLEDGRYVFERDGWKMAVKSRYVRRV